jgi:hypothetical protein
VLRNEDLLLITLTCNNLSPLVAVFQFRRLLLFFSDVQVQSPVAKSDSRPTTNVNDLLFSGLDCIITRSWRTLLSVVALFVLRTVYGRKQEAQKFFLNCVFESRYAIHSVERPRV